MFRMKYMYKYESFKFLNKPKQKYPKAASIFYRTRLQPTEPIGKSPTVTTVYIYILGKSN